MKIRNKSVTHPVFLRHARTAATSPPPSAGAIRLGPGEALDLPGRRDGLPGLLLLYRGDGPGGSDAPFWSGLVDAGAAIEADAATGHVGWGAETVDAALLARAQTLIGDDAASLGVTSEALAAHARLRDPRGAGVVPALPQAAPAAMVAGGAEAGMAAFSPCDLRIAQVALDAVLIVLGAGALIEVVRAKGPAEAAAAIGHDRLAALGPAIKTLGGGAAGSGVAAATVFTIVANIGKENLPLLFKAALSDLDPLDKVLYGAMLALRGAALVAAVVTGVATPAYVALISFELVANTALLMRDVVACYGVCNFTDKPPTAVPEGPGGSYIVDEAGRRITVTHLRQGLVVSAPDPAALSDRWLFDPVPGHPGLVQIVCRCSPDGQDVLLALSAFPDMSGSVTLTATGDPATNPPDPYLIWTILSYQMPAPPDDTPNPLTGYVIAKPGGSLALYSAGDQTLATRPFVAPSGEGSSYKPGSLADPGFLWRDLRPASSARAMTIGWQLEFDLTDLHWGFWNGIETNPQVPLPIQSGTLERPDDPNYWSVIAMTNWSGSWSPNQGIALARCWTDAAGPHVQVAFNARGAHFPIGREGPLASSVAKPDVLEGMLLTAWLIPTPPRTAGA